MTLTKGTLLGPYEILDSLGAGGMGEVYRAHDTRLDRTVAIKVLSSHLRATPELRARFEREARAVSQLSHPHICTLHDIRHEGDIDFLIMEFIEGETLAARLHRAKAPGESGSPLDVDEALRFAVEIAGALNHAHQRGVIHRDLKPANIMLTKGGVKLLDFGLAKLKKAPAGEPGPGLATASLDQTGEGMMVGTIPYMSPEQLEGAETDARSDIFALGAVIYEMLSGRRAFEGRSQASIIAAVMSLDPPPLTALRPLTPPALDHIVRRCLAKDPDDRWQTAQDVAAELRWIAEDRHLALTPSGSHDRPATEALSLARTVRRGRWRRPAIGGAILLLVSGVLVTYFFRAQLGLSDHRVRHLQIDVKPAERLSTTTEIPAYQPSRTAIAVSPDGRTLVFSGRRLDQGEQDQKLYRRSLALDTAEAEPLPGSEGGSCPFFSPDGRWIGFFAEGALRKILLRGGTPVDVCKVAGFFGASWGTDGTIVFAQDLLDGLWRISSEGGSPQSLTSLDRSRGEVSHRLPYFLPGTRSILYTVLRKASVNWLQAEVVAKSLETGEVRILAEDAVDARFMQPGILLFMRRGSLMAAPFDEDRLVLRGGTSVAVRDVMQTINTGQRNSDSGSGQYAVSASGTLAYVLGGITREQELSLAWRDLEGSTQPLQIEPKSYLMPQISPDGHWGLIWTMTLPRTVWLIDLGRQIPMPLPVAGNASFPIWGADGKTVTFMWARDEGFSLARMPVDGTALPEILLTSDKLIFPMAWSRDGRILMYQDPLGELRLLENEGDKWKSRSWMQPPLRGEAPCLSPDGQWVAYDTFDDEAGKFQVYVARFPGPGGRQLITTEPAVHPVWAPSGRELYFTLYSSDLGVHKFVSVAVTPGDPPVFGKLRILFGASWGLTGPGRAYDLAPDGRRILCVLPDQRPLPPPPSQIQIITRWPEEFKSKIIGK
jgi:serine/threonine-protein kinase